MKQLFVHIGMPKAGSTAIQTAFFDGRQNLTRHGVHYVSLMQNHSRLFHYVLDSEKGRMRRGFQLPHIEGLINPSPDELRSAMIAELRDTPSPVCVLSGEGLFDLRAEEVEKLAACLRPTIDQIKIVAYVREPISWATSRAQQNVKKKTITLADVSDPAAVASYSSIVPNYRPLEHYVSVFGLQNVLVRALDKSTLLGGDLLRDLCAVIGRPEAADALVSRRSNLALSAEAVLLMDAYNQIMIERGATEKKPTTLRRYLEDLPGTPFALPRALLEEIVKVTAPDLAWLEETFGVALKLSALPEKDQRPAWGPEMLRALVLRMEDGPPRRARKPKTNGPTLDWSHLLRVGARP